MVIALNKLHGILESFTEQKGILRLFVRLDSISSPQRFQSTQEVAQNVESQSHLFVLLLEDSAFVSHLLHQPLQLGFKENNIIVATELKGIHNTFRAEILKITQDSILARLTLASNYAENGTIDVLCALDFVEQNGLKVGDSVFWHIPENEIMLFFDTKIYNLRQQ